MNASAMDTLDRVAGLDERGELFAIRRERPEYVAGIEQCRDSVLTPHDERRLPAALRTALAVRMSRASGALSLQTHYQQRLASYDPGSWLRDIAAGSASVGAAGWIQAVVEHCDRVTCSPAQSRRQDIERLLAAGLTTPQIVALSELIAFVNFEARVAAGLTLLEALP